MRKVIPSTTVPHDYLMSSSKEMAETTWHWDSSRKLKTILNELANNAVEYATWYLSLDDARFASSYENCMRYFYILDDVCKTIAQMKDSKTGEENKSALHYAQKFDQLYKLLEKRVGNSAPAQ